MVLSLFEYEMTFSRIRDHGLFVARLNNGDWMVGKATYIYHISITDDHYRDPNLFISADLADAVEQAVRALKQ